MTNIPDAVKWEARNPGNLNYSRPVAFRLDILNLPQVSFFCQAAPIPGISLGTVTQPTPLANLQWPGEKLTWEQLRVKFILQSDFQNYIELYKWFIGLGAPTNSKEFQRWIDDHKWNYPLEDLKNRHTAAQMFSDGVLTVLSANNVPSVQFHFANMFPTSVTGIEFDISTGRTDYLTAYATFSFQYFVPVPLATET